MFEKLRISLLLLLIASTTALAQKDSLLIDSNTLIIGEVKSMDKGVLTMETNYSDSDFTIEWLKN